MYYLVAYGWQDAVINIKNTKQMEQYNPPHRPPVVAQPRRLEATCTDSVVIVRSTAIPIRFQWCDFVLKNRWHKNFCYCHILRERNRIWSYVMDYWHRSYNICIVSSMIIERYLNLCYWYILPQKQHVYIFNYKIMWRD